MYEYFHFLPFLFYWVFFFTISIVYCNPGNWDTLSPVVRKLLQEIVSVKAESSAAQKNKAASVFLTDCTYIKTSIKSASSCG